MYIYGFYVHTHIDLCANLLVHMWTCCTRGLDAHICMYLFDARVDLMFMWIRCIDTHIHAHILIDMYLQI